MIDERLDSESLRAAAHAGRLGRRGCSKPDDRPPGRSMGRRRAVEQHEEPVRPALLLLDEAATGLLERIEAEREGLGAVLGRVPPATVARRPLARAWSVLENVQHLLFAEQLHLGQSVSKDAAWSPLGFTPATMRAMRKLPPVEGDGAPRLADVLDAWDRVHQETVQQLSDLPVESLHRALERYLRHLRAHITVIERLAQNAAR